MPNSETDFHIDKAILIQLSEPGLKSPEFDVCSALQDYRGNSDKCWTTLSRQIGNLVALHESLYSGLRLKSSISMYHNTRAEAFTYSKNDLSYACF